MANIKFTNFARSKVATGINSSATTLAITGGTGALFPALTGAEYFYLTLENSSLVREIVKVTARTADTLTIVRAQDGTTAVAWVAGDVVSLRFNAAAIADAVTGTLLAANNLSDIGSAATARANLSAAAYGANSDITSLSATTTINGYTLGYRDIPQNSQSAPYTLALSDSGKHILHPSADTTARTFTIPANASIAFPVGTAITVVNQNAAGIVTISITSDTMRLAGVGTTGSRSLAANGIATALKITSTEWIISGTGLS
jgi:hypothetical protein